MLSFEFEEPFLHGPCECCGGTTTRLTRFVYKDGDAHAVYYAQFTDGHAERVASAVISLGTWGEGGEPRDRLAFPLRLRSVDDQYQVMCVDADQSPWQDAEFLGRMLDREEALRHPWIKEVFHITDHMVLEDVPLKSFLDGDA
jgi:hypothetical protein